MEENETPMSLTEARVVLLNARTLPGIRKGGFAYDIITDILDDGEMVAAIHHGERKRVRQPVQQTLTLVEMESLCDTLYRTLVIDHGMYPRSNGVDPDNAEHVYNAASLVVAMRFAQGGT